MTKFVIRDREAGNIIDSCDTYEEVLQTLDKYENEDKEEGTYTPDFYEIIEREEV